MAAVGGQAGNRAAIFAHQQVVAQKVQREDRAGQLDRRAAHAVGGKHGHLARRIAGRQDSRTAPGDGRDCRPSYVESRQGIVSRGHLGTTGSVASCGAGPAASAC